MNIKERFKKINASTENLLKEVEAFTKSSVDFKIDNEDFPGLFTWHEANKLINIINEEGYKGYDDWRLPTRKELNYMYLNRGIVGGFSSDFYWSDTECRYDFFSGGYQYFDGKSRSVRVRLVRSM